MALTASRFGFRPSKALGIDGELRALFFDIVAATVASEFEAEAYRGIGSPKGLPQSLKDKAEERFNRQELERLGNG